MPSVVLGSFYVPQTQKEGMMTIQTEYELQPEFRDTFKDMSREDLLQYIKRLQQTVNGLTEGVGIVKNEVEAAYAVMSQIEEENRLLQQTVHILVDFSEVVIDYIDEWTGTYFPTGSRQRSTQLAVEDLAARLEALDPEYIIDTEETQ